MQGVRVVCSSLEACTQIVRVSHGARNVRCIQYTRTHARDQNTIKKSVQQAEFRLNETNERVYRKYYCTQQQSKDGLRPDTTKLDNCHFVRSLCVFTSNSCVYATIRKVKIKPK